MKIRISSLALLATLILGSCDDSPSPVAGSGSGTVTADGILRSGSDTTLDIAAGKTTTLQFTPKSGTTWLISTTGTTPVSIELRDASGTSLAKDPYPSGKNASITWISTSATPVNILVYGDNDTTSGKTILHILQTGGPDDLEADGSLHSAQLLPADSSAQRHTFTDEDVDWVKIPVQAGKKYRVATTSIYTSAYIKVFTGDSTLLTGTVATTSLAFKATTTGFAYAKLSPEGSSILGAYSVRAWSDTTGIDTYESDDTRATASLIPTDGTVQSHFLDAGEHDWVKFHADSGKHYDITLTDTASNKRYRVFPDSGAIASTDSAASSISWQAPRTGSVFLDLVGTSAQASGHYGISVKLDTVTWDRYEPDSSRATATWITTDGVSQSHYLRKGEHDWFKFQADSGIAYVAFVTGPTGIEGLTGKKLTIYPDSTANNYVNNGLSTTNIKLASAGTAFVDFSGYAYSDRGPYFIGVERAIDKYEPDNSQATAHPIVVDSAAQQLCLYSGENDWIRFEAVAGTTYHVVVSDPSTSLLFGIYDSTSSTSSLTTKNYGDGTITWKARTTGTLYVGISSPSSEHRPYTLQVTTK
jgi:hypothetical protein